MIKDLLKLNLRNSKGWRTNRKILVIQSDDWGAVRTSNKNALLALRKVGIDVDKCHYTRFDALEGSDDLCKLFEVLNSVQDKNGNKPKMTANCLVANPDFEAIEKIEYSQYIPESVLDTFKRSERTKNSEKLWFEGLKDGLFYPQSHSREHFNVNRWMSYIQSGDDIFRLLFKNEMYALSSFLIPGKPQSYLSALQLSISEDAKERNSIVIDGLNRFEKIFGYKSTSFIAPNYVWDKNVEDTISNQGVSYIQTSTAQQPTMNSGSKPIRRFHGQMNKNGQIYLLRNVNFEPSSNPSIDWIPKCMNEIATAFTWKKPAILSTHRVNFIGALDHSNSEKGLQALQSLLNAVVKRWPDIEFLTTEELGDTMSKDLVSK